MMRASSLTVSMASTSPRHARRRGRIDTVVRAASALLIAACLAASPASVSSTQTPTSSSKKTTTPRATKESVDACEACAAVAHALHDAMSYQLARRQAAMGTHARFDDLAPEDAVDAVNAAASSACGERTYWTRFRVKSIGTAGDMLSGPGLDAHFAPGIDRTDADDDVVAERTNALRGRCVAEAERVGVNGLLHAFNASMAFDARAKDAPPSAAGGVDEENDDEGDVRPNDAAAAFASMVCVQGELVSTGARARHGWAKTARAASVARSAPCSVAATKEKARNLLAAVGDDATAQAMILSEVAEDREALRRRVDACAGSSSGGGRARERSRAASVEEGGDPTFGLGVAAAEEAARCTTLARAMLSRGLALERLAAAPSVADSPAAAVHLEDARLAYSAAEAASWRHAGEAALRTARLLATSTDAEKRTSEDSSAETSALARAAASRSVAADPSDPDARLTLADVLAHGGDPSGALGEYLAALRLLPFHGEVAAAATSARGTAAAAVAHQFAAHLVAIEEHVEGLVGGDEDGAAAEKVAEARAVADNARAMGAARAKEAAENHLEALVLAPTRRRHVSMAASMLAHASLAAPAGDLGQWRGAVATADVVDKCDEARPPEECYHVLLGHARNLMDLGLWALAREAARLAVQARGEKGQSAEHRAASNLAREAEKKMDGAADQALLKRAGWDGDFDAMKRKRGKHEQKSGEL